MIVLLAAAAGEVVQGGAVLFLTLRHTRHKEALFAARRQAAHAQARHEAAKKAARAAERRCAQALRDVELSLARAGQAMEVAGHIRVVSEQLHDLTEFITSPMETGTGRHALPDAGAGQPAVTDGGRDDQDTRELQEAYVS